MYHVHQSKDEIKGQEKGGRMVERGIKGGRIRTILYTLESLIVFLWHYYAMLRMILHEKKE